MALVILSRGLIIGALAVHLASPVLSGEAPVAPVPPFVPEMPIHPPVVPEPPFVPEMPIHPPVEPEPPFVPDMPDEDNHLPVAPVPPILDPIINPGQNPIFPGSASVLGATEVSQVATNGISQALKEIVDFCAGISGSEYNVDCLGDKLGTIAAEMPSTGDYAEVQKALEVASRDLARLAKDNASSSLPRGVARQASDPTVTSSRPLVPIETASLPQVNAEATAILDELETVLLRSAQASEQRRSHYQQIAAAVDSNKVLLRSS